MRSMKFSSYPVRRLQPTTFDNPFPPDQTGVTLNSFAAFAAAPLDDTSRYQPGGDIYSSINNTYGPSVAGQTAAAANQGDRGLISTILGSAIPLGQPGGGSVQPALDDSTSDIFWDQIYNEPLVAPIEEANRVLTSTGNAVVATSGMSKIMVAGVIGLVAWYVLAHNK